MSMESFCTPRPPDLLAELVYYSVNHPDEFCYGHSWRLPDGRTRCPLLQTARQTCVASNGSPATHQTPRQQGGSGGCGHIQLADSKTNLCGYHRQSSHTPNSTTARRNWKMWPHSTCRQQDKPVWLPTAVQPHTKLQGSKEEVEDVATFNLQTARQTCVTTNGSPATHQTPGQQGGSGRCGHIHPADCTLSVAATEKKTKKLWAR